MGGAKCPRPLARRCRESRLSAHGGRGGDRRLATLSPAPGPGPQHGLAELARALAVGLRLRASLLRLRAAPESPRLPSAAGLPRPAHDAQPAAALPNRVSAPAPSDPCKAREGGHAGRGDAEGTPGVLGWLGLGGPKPEQKDRETGRRSP